VAPPPLGLKLDNGWMSKRLKLIIFHEGSGTMDELKEIESRDLNNERKWNYLEKTTSTFRTSLGSSTVQPC
jgi:hypothetical protein